MSNDTEITRLMNLKKRAAELSIQRSRIEGEIAGIKKTMREEFGTDDAAELQKQVATMEKKLVALRKELEMGLASLEKEKLLA